MSGGRVDFQRPLRDGWIVYVEANKVLDAAKAKFRWHTQRAQYWTGERERLKDEAATRGIVMDDPEDLVQLASYSLSNRYEQRGPRLDPEYAAELQEADSKMKEHAGKVRTYKQWVDTLSLVPSDERLDLEHGDRLFFGLSGGVEEGE